MYAARHAAIAKHTEENTFRKHLLACVNSCGIQEEPSQDEAEDASTIICLQWTQQNLHKKNVVRRSHFSTQHSSQTHDSLTGHAWQQEYRRKTLCLEHIEPTHHQMCIRRKGVIKKQPSDESEMPETTYENRKNQKREH